jgi:hypothetical protein
MTSSRPQEFQLLLARLSSEPFAILGFRPRVLGACSGRTTGCGKATSAQTKGNLGMGRGHLLRARRRILAELKAISAWFRRQNQMGTQISVWRWRLHEHISAVRSTDTGEPFPTEFARGASRGARPQEATARPDRGWPKRVIGPSDTERHGVPGREAGPRMRPQTAQSCAQARACACPGAIRVSWAHCRGRSHHRIRAVRARRVETRTTEWDGTALGAAERRMLSGSSGRCDRSPADSPLSRIE